MYTVFVLNRTIFFIGYTALQRFRESIGNIKCVLEMCAQKLRKREKKSWKHRNQVGVNISALLFRFLFRCRKWQCSVRDSKVRVKETGPASRQRERASVLPCSALAWCFTCNENSWSSTW